jgi:predicted alpha/beta-fold hydrolase
VRSASTSRANTVYARRFLRRLEQRIRLKEHLRPGLFDLSRFPSVKTIYDFDDVYTAPAFGFGTADNYYATQSAQCFLDDIRVPALVIQAQDDPLVPFEVYNHPAFSRNPNLQLMTPEHGGHVGFIARGKPRFWLDGILLEWLQVTTNKIQASFVV